jgi:hypothetical protein
LVLVENLQR